MPAYPAFDRASLVAVLSAQLGPTQISYRDALNGTMKSDDIKPHQTLLIALRGVAASFAQSTLELAIHEVAVSKAKDWNMQGADASQFACDTSRRLRAMLRDISQTLVKNQQVPDWAQPYVASGDAAPAASAAVAPAAGSGAPAPRFEWDPVAVRATMLLAGQAPKMAKPEAPQGADPDDECIAVFGEHTWTIPGFTVRELAEGQDEVKPVVGGAGPGGKKTPLRSSASTMLTALPCTSAGRET